MTSINHIKKITTADNTESFLNETVGESYHSHSGAVEEAYKKYVVPCNIKELAQKGSIKILDVCFGIGYNSAMAISTALEVNPNCHIEVVGLENDPEIIKKMQEINPPIPYFHKYKQLTPETLQFIDGNIKVTLLIGDARVEVKKLSNDYFDAIFFDPFSPKTAPDMWAVDFFKEMYRVLNAKGILATYSCARIVRDNLRSAEFTYDDGPIVGRRGPGTIAFKFEI